MTATPMILQSDPQWLPERRGRGTASRMNDMAAFLKGGREAEARRKYKIELVAERMHDWAVSRAVTPPMQRGLDYEPDGRAAYEAAFGVLVEPAALVHHPRIEWFSATPDGFIGDDGLLEIKVPLVTTYVEWIAAGVIPEQHILQMTAQLAVTGRAWVDFCAYCPEMPQSRRLFVRRLRADPEAIANVEATAAAFLKEVDELFDVVTTAEMIA